MFERYTESARRAIFFALHAAELAGHNCIDPADLLKGLAQEWPELRQALDFSPLPPLEERLQDEEVSTSWWRKLWGGGRRAAKSRPFSEGSKHALRHGLEFSRRAGSRVITVRHLLMGIAREDPSIANFLAEKNVNPQAIALRSVEDREFGSSRIAELQVGIGYDYHRLVEGRKLVVGGIEIAFSKGLTGHSDGDVLTHAICDALLGAAGLGDLGQHFPDTDPRWKDVSSLELLTRVADLVGETGFSVAQVDTVVIAQEPKLAPYFALMREKLAHTLGTETSQVNVKAKTTEGLEAIGRGEAMAAQAVALLESHRRRGNFD